MSTVATPPQNDQPSALDLINALDGDQIRARLVQLDAERDALTLLLRAVSRRERAQMRGAAEKAKVAS
jgi:hypothetical protein